MQKQNRLFHVLTAVLLIAVIFSTGFFVGFRYQPVVDKIEVLANKEEDKPETVDFSPFWKAWDILDRKFVPTSIDAEVVLDQDKVWSAIEGLAASYGDPYTVFLPPVEKSLFEDDISGNFEGVGMEIGLRDEILTVIAPLKDTPAYNAGLKAGDQILKIDDTTTSGMTVVEAVQIIRGERGTTVTFTVFREDNGPPFEIPVVRDVIDIPTIETSLEEGSGGKVFVIRLFSFSATSVDLFRNALMEFSESGTNNLVIDLRGNPGGFLEAAVDMASWFLPEGKIVVQEYFGDGENNRSHRSRGYDIFNDQLDLVILIDAGSASASEILAGALSEHGVATLVGSKSFGKGSVQELVGVTGETSLKVTIARWLTPEGNSISQNGLEPDVVVELTQEDFDGGADPQLDKAIEILLEDN